MINGAVGILKSASRESSVKRVVYTSSSVTTGFVLPNTPVITTHDSWNDLASTLAWAPPPYEAERKWIVYAASKTEAERACWKFVEEAKPRFEFNTMLPSVNFGAPLHEGPASETLTWLKTLVKGDVEAAKKEGLAPSEFYRLIIVSHVKLMFAYHRLVY